MRILAALLILGCLSLAVGCAKDVQAFGLGKEGARFGGLGAIGKKGAVTPPVSGFLLTNTGSALLVNTGSKFLVQ